MQEGFAQRGSGLSGGPRSWAAQLAGQLLAASDEAKLPWSSLPVRDKDSSENPWALERRKSADGQDSLFLSSLPVNETFTRHSAPAT